MPEKLVEQPDQPDASAIDYRPYAAYVLMAFLVVFTSVGAGLIYLPAGLIVFGITSGLFGYLLGAD